jgi:hypothetical protein
MTILESYLSILSYSLYIWIRFTCFSTHPIVIIRYNEKRSNRKKKKEKKKKKTRHSRLSYIGVGRLVVTTIRRSSLLFFLLLLFFFFSSAFLLPSISLTSPLVCMCSSGQFECMAKFGQARTIRREGERERNAQALASTKPPSTE